MDLLRPSQAEFYNPQHAKLIEFIAAIASTAPTVLVGQLLPLPTTHTVQLEGLTVAQLETLLRQHDVFDAGDSIIDITQRLHTVTKGNPRLCLLAISLYQQQGSWQDILVADPEKNTDISRLV